MVICEAGERFVAYISNNKYSNHFQEPGGTVQPGSVQLTTRMRCVLLAWMALITPAEIYVRYYVNKLTVLLIARCLLYMCFILVQFTSVEAP